MINLLSVFNKKESKKKEILKHLIDSLPDKLPNAFFDINTSKDNSSIYLDIYASNEEEAKETGRQIAQFLMNPSEEEAPENYYEPYFGGVARWITGDLLGNAERTKNI